MGSMFNLVLPIVSGLACLPVQDLSDPIGELVPEDAFAAIRIASIDEFSKAFGTLDAILSPGEPSSANDPLQFFLNLDPEQIRADLPVVMTISSGAQGVARGFIVPVNDHEAFAAYIRDFTGEDLSIEHIGAYAGYMMGGEYVAGGSKLGESWPVTTDEDPVLFARVDMMAVESTFGPLINQGLEMMEISMGETPVPEGSEVDFAEVGEMISDFAKSLTSSAEMMDLALHIKNGDLSLSSELLVREGSDMAGLGSDKAPTDSNVAGALPMDGAIQVLGHMEHDKYAQWFEPLLEMTKSMVPALPGASTDLAGWLEHTDELGSAMALSMDFDSGVPTMAAVYEVKEGENDFYEYVQGIVATGAAERGAEVQVLDAREVNGVQVKQIATVEPEATEPAVPGTFEIPNMTSSFARSGGLVLVTTVPTGAEAAETKLAAQIALLKSPASERSEINTVIKALGAANPAIAMNLNLNLLVPQLVASGEVAAADAPTFEGPASVRMFGGVAGLRWLGHVSIPLSAVKAMNDLGSR